MDGGWEHLMVKQVISPLTSLNLLEKVNFMQQNTSRLLRDSILKNSLK